MKEYFLLADHWPGTLPRAHRELLHGIVKKLSARAGLLGLAIGGSFASDQMDDYSDLDLKVLADAKEWHGVAEARKQIAASIGPLVSAFTAEHIGVPQMLICLYGDLPIHVDLNFMLPEQLASMPEELVVLWDRDGTLRSLLANSRSRPPTVDWQWIEDRFWTWIHYAATKMARGELFEAIRFLLYLAEVALGPIAVETSGGKPNGLRRLEQIAGASADRMRSVVAPYERDKAVEALFEEAAIYRSFRNDHAPQSLKISKDAERIVMSYLENVLRPISGKTT